MINAVGVGLFTVMLVTALGHCVRPLRCFTKLFGALQWVAFIGFFIAANVFRFRDEGRLCSMEYVNVLIGSAEIEWYN